MFQKHTAVMMQSIGTSTLRTAENGSNYGPRRQKYHGQITPENLPCK